MPPRSRDMNRAVFVNVELRLYVGRRVRARIKGETIIGKSTDECQLVVKGIPTFPLTKFVEFIGIADSDTSIQANTWTNLGKTTDTYTYNQLCQIVNGEYKILFV